MLRGMGLACALLVTACGCSKPSDAPLRMALEKFSLDDSQPLAAMDRPSAVRTDAPDEKLTWLALGKELSRQSAGADAAGEPSSFPASLPASFSTTQPAGTAASRPATTAGRPADRTNLRPYVPWPIRRGPAYPGDFWTSFGRDSKELPLTLWSDTVAAFTNPVTLVGMGFVAATGIVLASVADNPVEDYRERHGMWMNHFWDNAFDAGGNPGTHFAIAWPMYFTTLATGDVKDYEISKTLINALIINDLLTLGLKVAVHNKSPNGDILGWPSGHTSSSFAFATVITEEYGPLVGAPFLTFATFVGIERVDARNHDFSDVISGGIMGIAIAHGVVQNHKGKVWGFEVVPYIPPDGGAGIALLKQW